MRFLPVLLMLLALSACSGWQPQTMGPNCVHNGHNPTLRCIPAN